MRLRADGCVLCVGHKGAAALAPENSLASLEAALAHGVDIVEFDVVRADGRLLLAHSCEELAPDAPSLDDALAFLAAHASPDTGLDVDLKGEGFEPAVVEALARYGLVERSVACSVFPGSLRQLKELEPRLATGLSYPFNRRNMSGRAALTPVVRAGVACLRAALPYRITGMLRRARADAAMLHFSVVSEATVARCHAAGAAVFAWTVDDSAELERVVSSGVDGVITNDPRLVPR